MGLEFKGVWILGFRVLGAEVVSFASLMSYHRCNRRTQGHAGFVPGPQR